MIPAYTMQYPEKPVFKDIFLIIPGTPVRLFPYRVTSEGCSWTFSTLHATGWSSRLSGLEVIGDGG